MVSGYFSSSALPACSSCDLSEVIHTKWDSFPSGMNLLRGTPQLIKHSSSASRIFNCPSRHPAWFLDFTKPHLSLASLFFSQPFHNSHSTSYIGPGFQFTVWPFLSYIPRQSANSIALPETNSQEKVHPGSSNLYQLCCIFCCPENIKNRALNVSITGFSNATLLLWLYHMTIGIFIVQMQLRSSIILLILLPCCWDDKSSAM